MTHTILVPCNAQAAARRSSASFAQLTGMLSHLPPSAWPIDEEFLIWREGSARGVAIELRQESTSIRMYTCASRVDVDLAIDATIALIHDGAGSPGFFKRLMAKTVVAVNEDDEEFKSVAELQKRYDDSFCTRYVTWGPQQIASIVEEQADPNASVAMTGPWCQVLIDRATIAGLRANAANDEAFSQAVLGFMTSQQNIGRQLRTELRQGHAASLATVPLPVANGVVAAWLVEDAARTSADMRWLTAEQLPTPVLLANLSGVLDLLTDEQRWRSPLGRTICSLALQRADSDVEFATGLADNALAAAQAGHFMYALAAFDVVVDMAPQNIGQIDVMPLIAGQATGGRLAVSAQSSWACNATWAVQADNNKLPVDQQRARHYLTRCLPYAPSNPAIYLNATCIAVELDDLAQALVHTANAKRCGYGNMQAFQQEPLLAPLRNHPGFAQAFAGG